VSRGHISSKKQRIERAQPREKRARDYIKNHKLGEGAAPVAKQTNRFQGGGKLRRSERFKAKKRPWGSSVGFLNWKDQRIVQIIDFKKPMKGLTEMKPRETVQLKSRRKKLKSQIPLYLRVKYRMSLTLIAGPYHRPPVLYL
jgi:hypothetical protein